MRSRNGPGKVICGVLLVAILCGALSPTVRAAPAEKAQLTVSGLGWLRNREQQRSLERLLGQERGAVLAANAIEDAAFLLMSALVEDGYLKPKLETTIVPERGAELKLGFDPNLETSLPRQLAARAVRFRVREGVRYRLDEVRFLGLHALEEAVARRYFVGEDVLIARTGARLYSPARLRRSVASFEGELHRRGYGEATVAADDPQIDGRTGRVDVTVKVSEGPRWMIAAVRIEGAETDVAALQRFVGEPWSQFAQQDIAALVRNRFFQDGHPDVQVRVRPQVRPLEGGTRPVEATVVVEPGPLVRVGQVRFEGAQRTQNSVLRRRVQVEAGAPLDVVALDQARFRLGRLGIFDSVNLHYEPATGLLRDPVFVVQEGREQEASLLFGYGSYEQFRGGVEWRRFNLFGRAHQSRLFLAQSVKSSRGEYSYTVPELLGESLDGTAKIFGLQRKEVSFLRQEYGGNFSLSMPVHALGANATLGYTYQSLRNRDNTLETRSADEKQVTAASVEFNLARDRRDNPLRPHHGYRWFLQTETASRYFGGSVDYQRVELGISDHVSWGKGRWIHLGLNHGVVTTFGGSNDTRLPVNKRFFPGGDNSIRGYREGEAAPIGEDGRFVGAKSYLLANVEVEQALTPKWSAVVFVDALGTAARLADYPMSEELYAVGLGVRYQTIIGPLRMEYGRNLNPRPTDPHGTLLFSVGFPF